MYSYIYADGRNGINYAIGCKTKDGINKLALDYIQNMIGGEIGYSPPPLLGGAAPVKSKEEQNILDAIANKDVDKSIAAWNYYATRVLKQTISCHKIEPFTIVE